jgi:hypothetical protein
MKRLVGADVDFDLLRSLAIIIGASILLVVMADYRYSYVTPALQGDFVIPVIILFSASLLIVFIADHVSGRISTNSVQAKAFVLATILSVSLLTVFMLANIAYHLSSGVPTNGGHAIPSFEGEAMLFIEVSIAYILLYVGIKGLLWD